MHQISWHMAKNFTLVTNCNLKPSSQQDFNEIYCFSSLGDRISGIIRPADGRSLLQWISDN